MAQGTCWDGYEQKGMKPKNGKMVPNCVPASSGKTKQKAVVKKATAKKAKAKQFVAQPKKIAKKTSNYR